MQVRRNVIPANAIMGRPAQQAPGPDPQTALALRRNQIALDNVNRSIGGVTGQIAVLSNSLRTISTQIQQSSALEAAKQAEENKQQRILAEQSLREGKEGLLERKIQTALTKPLQKVGGAAQKSLFNLGRFFNILLLGTLGNRILRVVTDLSGEGKLSLGNLFDRIKKDLAIVTAIFVGVNGGFVLLLRTLGSLTARLTGFAVNNLLLRPIRLAFSIAGGVLAGIANQIRNLPPTTAPPAGQQPPKGQQQQQQQQQQTKPSTGIGAGLRGALKKLFGGTASAAVFNMLMGGNIQESLTSGLGFGGTLALGGAIGLGGLPLTALAVGGSLLVPGMFQRAGINIPGGDTTLTDLGIPDLPTLFNRLTKSETQLQQEQSKANTVVINNTGGGGSQPQEVPSSGGSGTANSLINVPSGNMDNPYMLNSLIQYNIGGVGL
jgi:hypothetical protein